MKKEEPFIGLVGLGYWGKNILRNLYELGVLHTACDSSREIISLREESFPKVSYTQNFEDLLQNDDIKAIAIATPAPSHYQVVTRALEAGKDVYVEKPLALNVKEGEDLISLARKNKCLLMVGHILQYHSAVIKLKEMIQDGTLGRIQYVYSNRLNIGKLRTEENILWSFAPHDVSVMLMLIGEEPVSVSAFGGDYLSRGCYDTTMTSVEFKNGVKGHVFVSWLHPFKEQKLVVVGSKGMAVFDDVSKTQKLLLYPHKIEWHAGKIPVAKKAEHVVVELEKAEPLKAELRHFAECVQKRKTPLTDGEEGLRVLKVLEAAEDSIKSGASVSISSWSKTSIQSSCFIHESAVVDEGVSLGAGSKVWHFSHILKNSKIGKKCILGQNVCIGPDVTIGDGCKIQNNVSIYKGVVLEDEVFCGPSCVFTNVYNPRAFIERKNEFLETVVKRGATIGANATIVCGNSIGEYALIGAGAVVKDDVVAHAVVAGVPAKQIGWACRCGVTLKLKKNSAICSCCGLEWRLKKDRLELISK